MSAGVVVPFEHRVSTRWTDFDGLGHVNHAIVLTYLEEGRDAFLAGHDLEANEYVVGRCRIDFNGEIPRGQRHVTVRCAVGALGSKSVTMDEQLLDAEGQVVVEAEFTIVLWDLGEGRSRTMTDGERASLGAGMEE